MANLTNLISCYSNATTAVARMISKVCKHTEGQTKAFRKTFKANTAHHGFDAHKKTLTVTGLKNGEVECDSDQHDEALKVLTDVIAIVIPKLIKAKKVGGEWVSSGVTTVETCPMTGLKATTITGDAIAKAFVPTAQASDNITILA